MSIMTALLNKFKKAGEFGVEHPATFLMLTSAFGWAMSCFAQVVAIMTNDKVPAKDKKFLVPQELADGTISVSLFLLCTRKFEEIGSNLVNLGKILPKTLDFLKNNPKEIKNLLGNFKLLMRVSQNHCDDRKEIARTLPDNIRDVLNSPKKLNDIINDNNVIKYFTDTAKNGIKSVNNSNNTEIIRNTLERFSKEPNLIEPVLINGSQLSKYAKGVGVLTSLIGSIISMNVLTPIVRNYIASFAQKKHVKDLSSPDVRYTEYSGIPSSPLINFSNKIILHRKPNMNSYLSLTQLKI